MTKGSTSSRLTCPIANGKDKSFQWNIEMKKKKKEKRKKAAKVESLKR